MSYWDAIWRIVRQDKTSTYRNSKAIVIRDGRSFKALSISRTKDVMDIMNEAQNNLMRDMGAKGYNPVSAAEVRRSAERMSHELLEYQPGQSGATIKRVTDSFLNPSTGSNIPGMDTSLDTGLLPNLWINANEAAVIYGQGGLPATIIDKKSKPIMKNGIRIVNSRLTKDQIDKVNESMQRTGLTYALATSVNSGLVYGGSLLFPMFKRDMPATLMMDIPQLARFDVLGKDCIDRYVSIDRNNTIHIPAYNPTAADFLNPRHYFIPYIGADVSGMRCARIVPIPQSGYWGNIMTMGWGNSDIQSWYQAVCNYEGIASSIPHMIRQMSILVHSYNVDLANAMSSAVTLKDLEKENTIAFREASQNNPISMDVIGKIESIERDFTAVAELSRITRQDVAAKAKMPEEVIWSSDKGAFSSGDQTDGINERQWEGIKYSFAEVEERCRNVAMIEVINALGKDRGILKTLPYTRLEIMSPRIENPEKRGIIISDLSRSVFDLVAAGTQLDSALGIVLPYGDDHLAPSAEVIKKVVKHQAELDERSKEKHELEMDLMEAQVENAGQMGAAPTKPKSDGGGYTRLEQRQKERTRGSNARREGLQKAEGKKL